MKEIILLLQMYEKGYRLVGILLLLKQYIIATVMPDFFFNKPTDADKTPGRPQCLKIQTTFIQMSSWLENEPGLLTLDEI